MSLSKDFNDMANKDVPKTPFVAYLKSRFDDKTAEKVLEVFEKMGLPPPQLAEEFLPGTEGCLLFLSPYGLVMRIENREFEDGAWVPDRINNSGLVLNPVATIGAGEAIIELCPGCHLEKDYSNSERLRDRLRHENIDFWDLIEYNSGRLPVKTPSFPEGVPVVIDRLAVRKLSDSIKDVSQALKQAAQEAREAQKALYGPLKSAFRDAWPDAEKLKTFWDMCRRYVREGKLIAGWNEAKEEAILYGGVCKPFRARKAAELYSERLKADLKL
jgi:hypothetical protein